MQIIFCVIRSKMFCGFCLEVQEWQMPFGSCGDMSLNSDGCSYIMVWKKTPNDRQRQTVAHRPNLETDKEINRFL